VRSVLFAAVAVAATFAAAGAAWADPDMLTSNAHTSTLGGCACGGPFDDKTSPTAPLISDSADSNVFGSHGHAHVVTMYGTQKVYADAFQALSDPGPDVQTEAYSKYVENFAAGAFVIPYKMMFGVTGSMSPEPPIGPGSDAFLHWDLVDLDAGRASLSFGSWTVESGLPAPTATFTAPAGHRTELDIEFSAAAFSENPFTSGLIFSAFQDTVHTYIDAVGGGPDAIGESGHDYASPTVGGGVPEPAGWALMLLGFGGLGAALRRRRTLAA
jgi:hypothetical protein